MESEDPSSVYPRSISARFKASAGGSSTPKFIRIDSKVATAVPVFLVAQGSCRRVRDSILDMTSRLLSDQTFISKGALNQQRKHARDKDGNGPQTRSPEMTTTIIKRGR
jgi:hypothetical protein